MMLPSYSLPPRACLRAVCAAKRTELDFRIRICSEPLLSGACLVTKEMLRDARDDDLGPAAARTRRRGGALPVHARRERSATL